MRSIGLSLVIPVLVWGSVSAHASPGQSASSAASTASSAPDLSAGTTICAALAKTIDSRTAKPGQAIAARVSLPVLSHGKVLLPNDAKIMGHVTLAKARSHGATESELAIVFDRAVLKDGSELPLALTVQAIGAPPPVVAAFGDDDADGRDAAIGARLPSDPVPTARQAGPTPRPQPSVPRAPDPDTATQNSRHPSLDAGNHGAIGLPDLTLTESPDATSGSVVKSSKKDVKLESGTELILRVLAPPGASASTTNR